MPQCFPMIISPCLPKENALRFGCCQAYWVGFPVRVIATKPRLKRGLLQCYFQAGYFPTMVNLMEPIRSQYQPLDFHWISIGFFWWSQKLSQDKHDINCWGFWGSQIYGGSGRSFWNVDTAEWKPDINHRSIRQLWKRRGTHERIISKHTSKICW